MLTLERLSLSALPERLQEIPQPPTGLYAHGTLPSFERPWLAVVGSRKYSRYGKDACEHLIRGLRGTDVVIVSGLALGIDAIAHTAALDAGLTTVAVPGSGLSPRALYPKSNAALAARIVREGGALLSEYEPETPAAPWTFPARNRIMVGLSHAVLLIEASEKSGTLITARLAAEYGRELLCVPGSIFSENSRGAHQFVRLGAALATGPTDIKEALRMPLESPRAADGVVSLSAEERAIWDALAEPCTRDALYERLSLPPHEVSTHLTALEISGVIRESMGVLSRAQ